jgi:hypothetical protein
MKCARLCVGILLLSYLFSVSCTEEEGTGDGWLIGSWATDSTYKPHTDVMEFDENGYCCYYDDYACTVDLASATWSLSGDYLTLAGIPHPLIKTSDDQFELSDSGTRYYRKGTEPGGSVFALTEMTLPSGAWTDGTAAADDEYLYTFTASPADNYELSWDDSGEGSGGYDGDIAVSAYASDQITPFFVEAADGYSVPRTVPLGAGEKLCVIVESVSAGTFSIMIQ